MIKSWHFIIPVYPVEAAKLPVEPALVRDTYDWYFDLWTKMEAQGFEGIFFSEHHVPANSLTPSPNILIAQLARVTKRMRFGTLAHTLPMNDPWRLAEEFGMLDHITGGRFEIGVARGAGPWECKSVGIPAEDQRARFEEALDILERVLTGEKISYPGKFWKLDNYQAMPPMLQKHAPRWTPVMTTGSAEDCAKRGYKVCAGFLSSAEIKPLFDAYKNAAAKTAAPAGPDQLGIRRGVFVSENDTEAKELSHQHAEDYLSRFEGLKGRVKPEEFIAGSPESVTEQIIAQCRATGAGHIMIYPIDSLPRDQVERSFALYAEHVLPRLKAASV